MNIAATNTIPALSHEPVTASLESTEIPAVGLDSDDQRLGVNIFAALMPTAARAEQPAANDCVAEPDDDQKPDESGASRGYVRGDASLKLRRIVGPRLFRARTLSGLRQTEAAAELGYSTPAQLNQWETARRLAPIFEVIKAADLYGVSVDYLVGTSDEPERDQSASLRSACLRAVRKQLERVSEVTIDAVANHAKLVGPHVGHVRGLLATGDELIDALNTFSRTNMAAFEDLRGGATVMRLAHEFEASLESTRTAIRLHDEIDSDLRRALAEVALEDELMGDDEA